MTNQKLLSFHGDPALKEKWIERTKWTITHCGFFSTYPNFSTRDIEQFESDPGLPGWILELYELFIFNLGTFADQFGADMIAAAPVGKDLNGVYRQLTVCTLEDAKRLLAKSILSKPHQLRLRRIIDRLIAIYKTRFLTTQEYRTIHTKLNDFGWPIILANTPCYNRIELNAVYNVMHIISAALYRDLNKGIIHALIKGTSFNDRFHDVDDFNNRLVRYTNKLIELLKEENKGEE